MNTVLGGGAERDWATLAERCGAVETPKHAQPHRRKGVALLIALFAIALVTGLILATIVRATQDTVVTRAETLDYRALAAAEAALWQGVVAANVPTLRSEPIGTTTTSEFTTADMTTRVWITRTDTAIVWLTATADIRQGVARAHHGIGLSAILDPSGTKLRPIPGRSWVDLF